MPLKVEETGLERDPGVRALDELSFVLSPRVARCLTMRRS